jgi:hypothetical protein
MTIQITEGSPIIDAGAYYHAGRGGAGNYRRLSSGSLSSSPPTTSMPSSTSTIFFGGRGGVGNAKPKTERAMFSFDEELERDRLFHQHHAPVYSIGRGGAGNVVPHGASSPEVSPRNSLSSAGEHRFSTSSLRIGADKVWDTLARTHSHQ